MTMALALSDNRQIESQSGIWLSTREVADLCGISWKQVKMYCSMGRYTTTRVPGNGGLQYRIALDSLPEQAISRYQFSHVQTLRATSVRGIPEAKSEITDNELDAIIYTKAPDYNRRKADKYLAVMAACDGLKGSRLREALYIWNKQHPEQQCSYPSLLREQARVRIQGTSALIGRYGNRSGATIIKDEWFTYYQAAYLTQGSASSASCWLYTVGHFSALDKSITMDNFPHEQAFRRRLDAEIPQAAQYLARNGQAKYDRKYAPYINRNYDAIRAGSVWVSDHHQLDVAVVDPATGKACFPWITVWRDFKTSKWLGWYLHCSSPNSDHIFMSFFIACCAYGLPDEILIDNGKDYRCKDFAGGRIRTVKVDLDETQSAKQLTTLSMLSVAVHYALPYNAQTKPIERDFRRVIELLCRHLVGYRGGNVVERPEILATQIKHGDIMPFETFNGLIDDFITNCFNRKTSEGKNLQGKSPDQLFAEEFTTKKEVSRDALMLFCMRTSNPVQIRQNGVYDNEFGVTYWGEWMSGCKGTRVYMRRNVKDYAAAWVFNAETHECMGTARMGIFDAPALVNTEVGRDELSFALAAQKRDKKISRSYIKGLSKPDAMDQLRDLKAGIALQAGPTAEAMPVIHQLANTKMDVVVREQKAREAQGTMDLSDFLPPEPEKTRPIFLTDTDKEEYERTLKIG
jgi:putative transposase